MKRKRDNWLDPTLPEIKSQDIGAILDGKADDPPPLKPAWEAVGLPKRLAFRDKPTARVFYDWSQVNNAVSLIDRLPDPGETVHAIMNSTFKGVDIAPAIQKLANRPAAELIVTTLGFNRQDAACLCEMVAAGKVLKLSLVYSNFFAEKDRGAFQYAAARFAEVGGRLAVSRNHSKIMLFDFGTDFYTVESSANLRSCNNLEQFCLSNSPELFAFHKSWVCKMLC